MEQKPVDGYEVLAPPSADIAQRYLDEAAAVATRRERKVDRRALAWLQIVNAVATAAYLAVLAFALRADSVLASQTIVFSFLLWVQLASGMAQRSGMQRRLSWSTWPALLAGGLLVATALVVFGFAVWAPGFPAIGVLIPPALVLVGLGGYGAVQLARASGDVRPPRSHPQPLSPVVRWGTILVGVALGVLMTLASPAGRSARECSGHARPADAVHLDVRVQQRSRASCDRRILAMAAPGDLRGRGVGALRSRAASRSPRRGSAGGGRRDHPVRRRLLRPRAGSP